jgi:colanic acid/amylovoran biosynthesis glycosyltransferase
MARISTSVRDLRHRASGVERRHEHRGSAVKLTDVWRPVWEVPHHRWVLHNTLLLGNLTERWIETQLAAQRCYGARLMGLDIAAGVQRLPHWLRARDRLDLCLAWRGMWKSEGTSAVWLAKEFAGDRRPALVHGHYGDISSQLWLLTRVLRVPLVASFYGYDATVAKFREERIWRNRYRRLFYDAGALIVEGPAMARRVESLGCPSDKIHVIRLPADAENLDGCERPKADAFRVAIAGRFAEKKGFDVAIAAFARALTGKPDAELLIIGGGELEREYRTLVRDYGIEPQVTWAGRLPFSEFMSRVATARVGLYPSRTARNGASEGGAPVTLAESQWLGVPSIVSDHDDLPYVAAPEGSIVLPATAVDEWADALRSLYDAPARLDRMGAAAAAFAQSEHSPTANAHRRERVYDLVTRRKSND